MAMIDAQEYVLLVDEKDRPTGSHAKLDAHRAALRHRAFSVFIADSAGNLLMQSRAHGKYHSGGLWSNACCGHPRVGESSIAAAGRRLVEEMGIRTPLKPVGSLSYSATLPNGWHENEIVHLFIGRCDAEPSPDPSEVEGWRRVSARTLLAECAAVPDEFTAWFKIYLEAVPDIALARL